MQGPNVVDFNVSPHTWDVFEIKKIVDQSRGRQVQRPSSELPLNVGTKVFFVGSDGLAHATTDASRFVRVAPNVAAPASRAINRQKKGDQQPNTMHDPDISPAASKQKVGTKQKKTEQPNIDLHEASKKKRDPNTTTFLFLSRQTRTFLTFQSKIPSSLES